MKKLFALAILSVALSAHAAHYEVRVVENDITTTKGEVIASGENAHITSQKEISTLNTCINKVEMVTIGTDFIIRSNADSVTLNYDLRDALAKNSCNVPEVQSFTGNNEIALALGESHTINLGPKTIVVKRLAE